MIRLIGYSCSPPFSYLPRIEVRVATVNRVTHPRYRWVRISVVLRLLSMLEIGNVGARDSCSSDP